MSSHGFTGPPLYGSRPEYTAVDADRLSSNRHCAYRDYGHARGHVLVASVPFDRNWGRSTQWQYSAPVQPKDTPAVPFAMREGSGFVSLPWEVESMGIRPLDERQLQR